MDIAIGFTGNYASNRKILKYYNYLIKNDFSIVFFHPLRLFIGKIDKKVYGDDKNLISFLNKKNTIKKDLEKFLYRYKNFINFIPHDAKIKIVFHTDYLCPLWCNEEFQQIFYETINKLLNKIENYSIDIQIEKYIEFHPGFTHLDKCILYKNLNQIKCKIIEKDIAKLASCLNRFKLKFKDKKLNFCIEPRAGSILIKKNKYESQTLNTLLKAAKFALKNHFYLVIDPGQTIFKRINEKYVWNEIFYVAKYYSNIVEEIHLHNFRTGNYRGHGIPTIEDIENFIKLINLIYENKKSSINIIFEIINVSVDNLIKIVDKFIKNLSL